MTTAHPPESRSADSTAVSDEGQAPPLVHEMAPGQRFPSPNQVDMERGPFWRAGLLPESPWEAHPVTIIANLGEPIGESRLMEQPPIYSHTLFENGRDVADTCGMARARNPRTYHCYSARKIDP